MASIGGVADLLVYCDTNPGRLGGGRAFARREPTALQTRARHLLTCLLKRHHRLLMRRLSLLKRQHRLLMLFF